MIPGPCCFHNLYRGCCCPANLVIHWEGCPFSVPMTLAELSSSPIVQHSVTSEALNPLPSCLLFLVCPQLQEPEQQAHGGL